MSSQQIENVYLWHVNAHIVTHYTVECTMSFHQNVPKIHLLLAHPFESVYLTNILLNVNTSTIN